jgi:hypothetical protein
MHGLLSLGPSGPFVRDSHPAWFFHADGAVRVLDMPGYLSALVEGGMDSVVARDLIGRMQAHGATRILWAGAQGGRRGHLHTAWDVRVATTTTSATEAVAEITGGTHRPVGAAPVASLEGDQRVLAAYTHRAQSQKVRLPSSAGPSWSRALRLPAKIHYHYTCVAYAAVAAGNVGATVTVIADSLPSAEHRLRSLTDVVLGDIAMSTGEGPSKP